MRRRKSALETLTCFIVRIFRAQDSGRIEYVAQPIALSFFSHPTYPPLSSSANKALSARVTDYESKESPGGRGALPLRT